MLLFRTVPLLNRVMGAEQLGGLLYITGLIAIVCPSVGQALNTSRLVVRRNYAVTNGDYDWILLAFGAVGSGVALWMSRNSLESPAMAVGVFLLFMFTVFRYYGDVEYRLNLNYQRYFIYYLLIGLGYLVGFGVYYITGQWVWIYLIGEGAALLFVGKTATNMANEELNRLKLVLVEKKKTGKWLAEQLGKDQTTISKWCTNSSQPDIKNLMRIADILKVDVNEILKKQ